MQYSFGNAITFKKQVTKQKLSRLLTKSKEEKLSHLIAWRICRGKYMGDRWSAIFEIMLSTQTHQLDLERNGYSNILKDIMHISFTNLLSLTLNENKIRSLQLLVNFNAPNIEYMDLSLNQVCAVRSFRKLKFGVLKSFFINGNYVLEMGSMLMMYCPSFSKLYFQLYSERAMHQDIGWTMKLPEFKISQIHLLCKNRILQVKIVNMLQLKLPKARVKVLESNSVVNKKVFNGDYMLIV